MIAWLGERSTCKNRFASSIIQLNGNFFIGAAIGSAIGSALTIGAMYWYNSTEYSNDDELRFKKIH